MKNFTSNFGQSPLRVEDVMREDETINALGARITRVAELLRELGRVASSPESALRLEAQLEGLTNRFYALQARSGYASYVDHGVWLQDAQQLDADLTLLERQVETTYNIDIRGSRRNLWIAGAVGGAMLVGFGLLASRASRRAR